MRRLPVISSMVASAKEKTDRAEAILGNAAAESKAASSTAGEAKEITFGIQKVRTGPDDGAMEEQMAVTSTIFAVDLMHLLLCRLACRGVCRDT